jgi:hypothetical protein
MQMSTRTRVEETSSGRRGFMSWRASATALALGAAALSAALWFGSAALLERSAAFWRMAEERAQEPVEQPLRVEAELWRLAELHRQTVRVAPDPTPSGPRSAPRGSHSLKPPALPGSLTGESTSPRMRVVIFPHRMRVKSFGSSLRVAVSPRKCIAHGATADPRTPIGIESTVRKALHRPRDCLESRRSLLNV